MYAQSYTPTSVIPGADPKAPKSTALEILADAWMDLHPGISLKYIPAPTGNYHDWLDVQLMGGTGPDIFWLWLGSLNDFADRGKAVPLNDYLDMPNKYMPDDPRPWKEHFKDPFLDMFSPKGNRAGIPLDLVTTGIFCNLKIMEEAGVDFEAEKNDEIGSPDDWASFMSWHERIADAGYIPCSPGVGITNQWWSWGILADQLCWEWDQYMDVLNYHEDRPLRFQEGKVSQEELNHWHWCHDFRPFQQPEVQEIFRILMDWSQYFPEGWTVADMQAMGDMFATGELGMLWDGSWRLASLLEDDRRDFDFGTVVLPPVTRKTTDLAPPEPILSFQGGYGSITYGINPKCIDKGCVDECVDFLMWITTPEHDAMIVNENPKFVPSHKDAKPLPEVAGLFVRPIPLVREVTHPFEYYGHQEVKWGDVMRRVPVLYFLGELTLQETMDELTEQSEILAPELLRQAALQYDEAGSWDLTQWDCEPEI